MNWTGGTLQRTKHANKGVIQKQRAYFARARTKLQQSPSTPTAPFRPEYLQERDGREVERHIPSFESGSVRHAGHSARKRRGEEKGHISPTARRQRRADDLKKSQATSPHFAQGKYRNEAERERQGQKKRRDTDADSEKRLLEANKKRLLRQQDWVGVTSSKPVDLQFLSIKNKSQIGKRRKLHGKSKAVARRRSPTTLPHRTVQDELVGRDNTFMSGALPVLNATDNVRVRIGSDALTNAASTQPNNYAQSPTNSDSMLFDEEAEDAVRQKALDAPQGVPSSGHGLTTNPRSTINRPAKSDKIYSTQNRPPAHRNLTERPNIHADERIRHVAGDSNTLDQSVQQSEAADLGCWLTHHVGGIERPLELVFGRRSPSRVSHTASPVDKIGEAQCVHAHYDAEETQTGHASRNVGKAHRSLTKRHPNPSAINDDEPWRTYLNTGISSSDQVCVDDGTGTSVPQPHVPAQKTLADCTSWPQRITQGNLTHANLSIVAVSLPAPKWLGARIPDAHPLPRVDAVKDAVKEADDNEAIWRSFVLGSDPQSVIDTIHTHNETSEDSTSRATKGYASTRLPLSGAVTSVNSSPFPSTPFRSLSGQASRISDDVQHAPHSGSRSITSAAPSHTVWGCVESLDGEDVQGEDQGDETCTGSRLGEQSTHASLQNHASHNNETFSDTGTSRSDLERCSRARDDVSRRAQASGSVVWQRGRGSSIWDNYDSDEAGIDLVDPDRLT